MRLINEKSYRLAENKLLLYFKRISRGRISAIIVRKKGNVKTCDQKLLVFRGFASRDKTMWI